MTGTRNIGLFGRIRIDFEAAMRHWQARAKVKALTRENQKAESDLAAAYVDVGYKAMDASLGMELPTFDAVRESRRRLGGAEETLQRRTAAVKLEENTLASETKKHTQVITELEAAHRPLVEAATVAQRELISVEQELCNLDASVERARSEINLLTRGGASEERPESIQQALNAAQKRRIQLEAVLVEARQEYEKAKALADVTSAKQAMAATGQVGQGDLGAARAARPADEAVVNAAKSKPNSEIANAQQEVVRIAKATFDSVHREFASIEDTIKRLEDHLAARSLEQKIVNLLQTRVGLEARLANVKKKLGRAKSTADAKAAELTKVNQVWQEAKGRCEQSLSNAKTGKVEAELAVRSAKDSLTEAVRRFGKALFEEGKADATWPCARKAAALLVKLAELTNRVAVLNIEVAETRVGAVRTIWYAACTGGFVCLVMMLVIVLAATGRDASVDTSATFTPRPSGRSLYSSRSAVGSKGGTVRDTRPPSIGAPVDAESQSSRWPVPNDGPSAIPSLPDGTGPQSSPQLEAAVLPSRADEQQRLTDDAASADGMDPKATVNALIKALANKDRSQFAYLPAEDRQRILDSVGGDAGVLDNLMSETAKIGIACQAGTIGEQRTIGNTATVRVTGVEDPNTPGQRRVVEFRLHKEGTKWVVDGEPTLVK